MNHYTDTESQKSSRGVSPVIGVILMTSITVILAATIGSFVLGLGGDVTGTAGPQFSVGFDAIDTNSDGEIEEVRITHEGGQSVDSEKLMVRGDVAYNDEFTAQGDSFSPGDSITFDSADNYNGDSLRVVWTSDDGGQSEVIDSFSLPI